jgi:LPXTG-motif cell wall-anchored protein
MKLAKKVLAVLVAVMMLAGLTAMAFADQAKKTTAEETVSGTTVTVKLYFEDCVGMKSFKYEVTYDADVLEYVKVVNGADKKTSTDCGDTYACAGSEGAKEPGKVLYGGYFGTQLFSSEDWKDKGEDGEVSINGEKFHVATFTFNVKEEKATEINFKVTADDGFGLSDAKVTLFAAAPTEPTEPSESEPTPSESEPTPSESEPTPSESEPTPSESEPAPSESEAAPSESEAAPSESEAVSGEPVPGSTEAANGGNSGNGGKGGPKTGDNMALAAAAAVVVLAGAAFVVSKKRK